MSNTFLLEVVTPGRRLLSTEISEFTAPGALGEFGVLPGHTAFVTVLKPGEVVYKKGGETGHIAIGKGYAEVSADRTILLVDSGEFSADIKLETVKAALAKLEEALKTLPADDPEYQATIEAYELSKARIKVKEHGK
ncbi:MAG: ATP synthase F1 subunit epsilon [Deltaproteobacteria bacterium]|nr:ATP synthase F1 subunit epsilon [Deltaproteobacteria bacterium]